MPNSDYYYKHLKALYSWRENTYDEAAAKYKKLHYDALRLIESLYGKTS